MTIPYRKQPYTSYKLALAKLGVNTSGPKTFVAEFFLHALFTAQASRE